VHQVGFSLHGYIEMDGQQNIKKIHVHKSAFKNSDLPDICCMNMTNSM